MKYPLSNFISFVENVIRAQTLRDEFLSPLEKTIDQCLANFEVQMAQAQSDMSYIFTGYADIHDQNEQTVAMLNRWISGEEDTILMPALVMYALEALNLEDSPLVHAAFMAALLAEVPNGLDYHNNMHYRKVVLHVIRLIVIHNTRFSETKSCFNEQQILSLIIAACIHDLGHQGDGNVHDRKYKMADVELRSFELARPYLSDCGLGNDILDDIRVLLICTDTSPFGDPISPLMQTRRAFEYHFGTDEEDMDLDLCDELAVLEQRDDLCLMCVMLHEADIFNSSAVSYETTLRETIAINIEQEQEEALPEDTLLFLDVICGGGFLSDSAQILGQDNFEDIRSKVMDDFKSGNKSYM